MTATTWRTLLADAGDLPDHEARRLVEEAGGLDATELATALDEPATRRAVAAFDALLARRRAGEPLQYVLGRWGFRRLDLMVDRRALIPRPETEVVAGLAVAAAERAREAGRPRPTVVDLGTGSGAIALSVAVECAGARVWAADRSTEALAVAAANLAGVGRAAARVTLAEGSWYDALDPDLAGEVDVIVANPPYVAADDDLPDVVARWEPTEALVAGPTGLEDVAAVVDGAADWLAPGGTLVVEIAPHQADEARRLATSAGLADPTVERDLAGRDRALVARRPEAGSAP